MTAYDGPAPGLEIWPAAPHYCDPDIAQASFAHTLAMCARADALGFDWVSVSEHHYAPYIMTPNPCVMAAALTQVVKRARIALLGPLVPLTNPIRLAEELAMLDVLSGGRLVVLFLRGTPNEHHTYDTDPAETRAMTQEGIDLILKIWSSERPFAWEGTHYRFSTISVWPRVVQTPHPPAYGSGNSAESVAFAAQRRMGIAFSFAPPEIVAEWVKLYREEAGRRGGSRARSMSSIAASPIRRRAMRRPLPTPRPFSGARLKSGSGCSRRRWAGRRSCRWWRSRSSSVAPRRSRDASRRCAIAASGWSTSLSASAIRRSGRRRSTCSHAR
jgi:alkanesulfonate monooxygenase SsuD/methylene tetrahydromethanopterin reductase-like flavin-dependent oxidoreductase (luciferase family)